MVVGHIGLSAGLAHSEEPHPRFVPLRSTTLLVIVAELSVERPHGGAVQSMFKNGLTMKVTRGGHQVPNNDQ